MRVRGFAAILLLLLSSLVVAPVAAQDADYKDGDSIEIFWGGKWWPGVVRKTGDDRKKWFVHFDGYGDNWDMWKEAAEIRRRAGVAAQPAPPAPGAAAEAPPAGPKAAGDPVVGEVCDASWNDSWYEIEVLQAKDGKYFVHWRGYGKESDEWLSRDRIRRKGEEKEVLPRRGREGNGGGLPPAQMVGKDVEVYWHGAWWPAVVKKTDGKRLWIRYGGAQQGVMEEWAVPERVREVGGAVRVKVSPADVPGDKGLEGLWWRAFSGGGSGQIYQYFRFFPDGRLYVGVSLHDDEVDVEKAQQESPSECGAYGVAGGKLHVELGGDAREWKPLDFERESADRWKLNGVPTFRAEKFPRGTRLEGTWISMNAAAAGDIDGVARSGGSGYEFRRDGTYRHRRWQTVAATKAGEHGSNAFGHEGTYEIASNRLVMKHKDGEQVFMIVPMGHDGARYDILRISWDVLRRRE
jgi:hypothetical protein